jgi:hypothetical protein
MNNSIKKNLVVMIIFLFIFSLAYSVNSHSTKTISNNKTSEPCNGYTLICAGSDHVFLIDMDKNVIHTWSLHGFPAKMLPGGSIIGDRESNDVDEYLNARGIRLDTTPLVRTL